MLSFLSIINFILIRGMYLFLGSKNQVFRDEVSRCLPLIFRWTGGKCAYVCGVEREGGRHGKGLMLPG